MFDFRADDKSVALVHENGVVTYGDLKELRDFFESHTVPGNLTFLVCSNTWESIAIYALLIELRVPLLLLRCEIREEEIEFLADNYKPWLIFWNSKIIFNHFDEKLKFGSYKLYQSNSDEISKIDPSIAVLIPTSGSTGNPQMVVLSRRNLAENSKGIINALGIKSADRTVTSLPMNYSFGLSVINTHFMAGASIVVTTHSVNERDFWDTIEKHRVTTISGVPHTFNSLTRVSPKKYSEIGINKITQAGGKLPKEQMRKMFEISREAKIQFYVMYGQTEATARISVLNWRDLEKQFGSVGKAIDGVDLWIEGEDGQLIVNPNEEGLVCISGSNVFLGYSETVDDLLYLKPKSQKLQTGDVGYLDSSGFLYLTGRQKRIAKCSGVRINLDDVDKITDEFGFSTVSISINDQLYVAVEEIEEFENLKLQLSRRIELHPNLITIVNIGTFPRNEAGKIRYKELESMVKQNLALG